jgi:S-formylglutathione hydrolase FrmB
MTTKRRRNHPASWLKSMINEVPPLNTSPAQIRDADEDKGDPPVTDTITVFTLRWYLRVIGIALILYALFLTLSMQPSRTGFLLVEIPLILLGAAGFIGSFFVRSRALMEMLSLFAALLSGLILLGPSLTMALTNFIVSTGIDQLRAQLVAALLLTCGAAIIGGLVGRRKWGTVTGAWIAFWFGYLARFIQVEMNPAHDPGGHLEPLNVGAFIHAVSVMGALAVIIAFIGVSVGAALSVVVFNPPFQTIRRRSLSRQGMLVAPGQHIPESLAYRSTPSRSSIIISWLGLGILLVSFLLASGAQPLFIYSPDVGLHNPPAPNQNNNNTNGGNTPLPTQGTVIQDSITSQALGGQSKPFNVYLPPTYNTPQGKNKHYPVLYLLHGSPGSYKDWVSAANANQSADTLIDSKKTPELIMAFPDGNGPIFPSEWGNSFNQQQLMETFVAVDLVKYVDQKYRTIPQAAYRGIGGLSMGGFGAMNIAVHHPDIFGTVISLGGYYRAEGSVWGDNANYIQQNSPIDVLPNDQAAWKLHIFLGAGTQDEPYYSDTREFAQVLDSLSIPYQLDVENGGHSWDLWAVQFYNALLWIKWG